MEVGGALLTRDKHVEIIPAGKFAEMLWQGDFF
jgi:hypothetical protein